MHHGLAAWWADHLLKDDVSAQIPVAISQVLVSTRRAASALYLAQTGALAQVASAFEDDSIKYVVLKGAATREEAYASPALRTACDVDLLVHTNSRTVAEDCLVKLGFEARHDAPESGHERTFSRGRVDIDLHWDILRPGRTRQPLVQSMLSRRVQGPKCWRLCDTDTVFLMLVHPAITKYVCSPHMGLNRVLDFLLFTQTRPIRWVDVAQRLDEAGLKTAAWCTMRWIQRIAPESVVAPAAFMSAIAPGPLRAAYLDRWIARDMPGRLLNRADWLIRAAFTLPMHDKYLDAWRAVKVRGVIGAGASGAHASLE